VETDPSWSPKASYMGEAYSPHVTSCL
jgi:hypothetical protein